ncbi:MAG: hypothetical protein ACXIUV_14085 [Alkalilacustris sp.]
MDTPTPKPPVERPRPSAGERWEYVVLGGSNRPPEPKVQSWAPEQVLRAFGSTPALVFLSALLAVAVLAPQAPGAHNWAAERAAQQATQATGATGAVTP